MRVPSIKTTRIARDMANWVMNLPGAYDFASVFSPWPATGASNTQRELESLAYVKGVSDGLFARREQDLREQHQREQEMGNQQPPFSQQQPFSQPPFPQQQPFSQQPFFQQQPEPVNAHAGPSAFAGFPGSSPNPSPSASSKRTPRRPRGAAYAHAHPRYKIHKRPQQPTPGRSSSAMEVDEDSFPVESPSEQPQPQWQWPSPPRPAAPCPSVVMRDSSFMLFSQSQSQPAPQRAPSACFPVPEEQESASFPASQPEPFPAAQPMPQRAPSIRVTPSAPSDFFAGLNREPSIRVTPMREPSIRIFASEAEEPALKRESSIRISSSDALDAEAAAEAARVDELYARLAAEDQQRAAAQQEAAARAAREQQEAARREAQEAARREKAEAAHFAAEAARRLAEAARIAEEARARDPAEVRARFAEERRAIERDPDTRARVFRLYEWQIKALKERSAELVAAGVQLDLADIAFPLLEPRKAKKTLLKSEKAAQEAVAAFVLSRHRPGVEKKTSRQLFRSELFRWHPDKIELVVLAVLKPEQHELFRELMNVVSGALNSLFKAASA